MPQTVETDDDTARRIHIADNRLSDMATFDLGALAAQLEAFGGDYAGTGFTPQQAANLMFKGMPEPGDAPTDDDGEAQFGVVIECDGEEQQAELLAELTGRGLKVGARPAAAGGGAVSGRAFREPGGDLPDALLLVVHHRTAGAAVRSRARQVRALLNGAIHQHAVGSAVDVRERRERRPAAARGGSR